MKKTMAEPKPSDQKTKLQKALDFKAKYEAMLQEGKEEAISTINEQIAVLGELGFHYELVEAGQAPKPKTQSVQRQKDQTKPCSVCNFLTAPNHDGRLHRSQKENKQPFTEAELAKLGLKKA